MEARLFPEGTIPTWTTSDWYEGRDSAPHLEQDGHRDRLLATRDVIVKLEDLWWPEDEIQEHFSVVDLGAGDGGLLSLLKASLVDSWGYDLQQTNVRVAHEYRRVNVRYVDVVNCQPEAIKWAPVAVATEMLEHLIDPHGFVKKVSEYSDYIVASSPWHETADNHYEFHTWAWDEEGYAALLRNNGFPEIQQHFRVSGAQIIVGAK